MHKLKRVCNYLFLFVFFCIISFTFSNNVLARDVSTITDHDGNGYARCIYSGKVGGSVASRMWRIDVLVYNNTSGNMISDVEVACTNPKSQNSSAPFSETCTLNDSNKILDYFSFKSEGGSWTCPTEIYVSGNPMNDYESARLQENDPLISNHLTIDLASDGNLSKQSGELVDANVSIYDDPLTIEEIYEWGIEEGVNNPVNNTDSCLLINDDLRNFLSNAFFIISVAGIIILVVMSIIQLVKVITGGEDDALRNFFKGLRVRIICVVVLLLLPLIVSFIITIMNSIAGAFGFNADNPLCGITEDEPSISSDHYVE